jgi:hypothetical protein
MGLIDEFRSGNFSLYGQWQVLSLSSSAVLIRLFAFGHSHTSHVFQGTLSQRPFWCGAFFSSDIESRRAQTDN